MLNNRPLMYIEVLLLTKNTVLNGQAIMFRENKLDEDTTKIKRHKRCVKKCQEAAWKRWGRSIYDSIEKSTT